MSWTLIFLDSKAVTRKGRVGVALVVNQPLEIRPQPTCLRCQFAELRADFLLRR
jgi:hypothetical protein